MELLILAKQNRGPMIHPSGWQRLFPFSTAILRTDYDISAAKPFIPRLPKRRLANRKKTPPISVGD